MMSNHPDIVGHGEYYRIGTKLRPWPRRDAGAFRPGRAAMGQHLPDRGQAADRAGGQLRSGPPLCNK